MAHFGTAFISIEPDLSAFGAGLGKKIEAQLAGVTPDLKQHIEVDVDRDTLARAGASLTKDAANIGSSISSSFADAFRGIATAAGGFLGVGSSFTALGSAAAAAAPLVLGLAVALGVLISSFAAAVAGAAALGIALAGALGPVALVAFAAIAKVVSIIKAIHDDGKSAASSTLAIANAQDQVKSATEGVANAQINLKQQTVAAFQAMQDAAEAVKDDLLSVQDAQLGIADASLSLREAQLALKEFKKDAPGLQGLFKKFTDVNVDTSGLTKALADARKASGGKLTGDDSLKLERLILNVRRAKLQEKHATDGLHDANVQLQRDRQTEAKYVKQGIRAYPGYTSAVQGLASAQRQLATAQRASAAASTKQAGELAKLSPLERKLATTFTLIGDAVKKAFGPAINGVLRGLNRALRIFVGVLKDPRIVRALKGIGDAIGGVFVTLAKTLSSKEFRDSFVTLAKGGAQLVKILGNRVFKDILKIFTRIAVAALPALVGLLGDFADTLDRWAKWIQKHPKQFKKDIDGLIGSFKGWLGVIIDVGGFLIGLGSKLKDLGDKAGRIFRDVKDAISDVLGGTDKVSDKVSKLNPKGLPPLAKEPPKPKGKVLGFDAKDLDAISTAFGRVKLAMQRVLDGIKGPFKNLLGGLGDTFRGFVQLVAGLISGKWSEAWRGLKNIVKGQLRGVLGLLGLLVSPFKIIGKRLGISFADAFTSAFRAVKKTAIGIVNALIGFIDGAIKGLNKILRPRDLGPLGHTPGVKLPTIPKIGSKPNPTKTTLRPPGGHSREPRAVAVAAPRVATVGDSATPSTTVVENVNISAPAAAVPDPRMAAALFSREIARRGA